MKINFWHSIEQRTVYASVDQWHSALKTCICAEGGHFKHMLQINLCRKQTNSIPREHLP